LLVDGAPFTYAVVPEGIRIGVVTYSLNLAGDSLALTDPAGTLFQCSRATGSTTAPQDISQAVDLVEGRTYQEGTLVRVPVLGITFQIPVGWTGALVPGSNVMVLGAETRQGGVVFITGQPGTSVETVMVALSQPTPLDQTTVLTPTVEPQIQGEWVVATYAGTQGGTPLAGIAAAMVHPEGRGVSYLAAGPASDAEYYIGLVVQLIDSTESSATAQGSTANAPQQSDSGATLLAQQWTDFLAGMRVTYMSTFTSGDVDTGFVGSSTRNGLFLCGDGRFFYTENNETFVDSAGTSGASGGPGSGSGQWRVITQGESAGLELRWSSGNVNALLLEYEGGETYLDVERHFVTGDNPYC
jgi:hypothetical protein